MTHAGDGRVDLTAVMLELDGPPIQPLRATHKHQPTGKSILIDLNGDH